MKTKRYFRTRIIALFGVGFTVIIMMWKNVSNSKNLKAVHRADSHFLVF